jgi:hypothetical protein|tara:strand:- start:60 stop:557 length:498 start_codon:yes stop_codon:yes gene_type:complete
MKELVINKTLISTDSDGRYSLNDLHKSSGSSIKDLPNKFMANASFKNVVAVLNAKNPAFKPVVRKQGRYNGGTWVSKELVYKYAMWVNAEFEVEVIQTFDSVVSKIDAPETMAALNELTLKIECDKSTASECGKALAHYKKVKKQNQDRWIKSIKSAQLSLGFGV